MAIPLMTLRLRGSQSLLRHGASPAQKHGDNDRHGHHGVVEQMQLNSGEEHLQHGGRLLRAKQGESSLSLCEQQSMLEEMPGLDHQRRLPPCESGALKGAIQNQQA